MLHTAFVDFSYDNRGRLIQETRTEDQNEVYDITYSYDQLGNRLSKIDSVAGLWTEYDYDVYEDWDYENELYGSWDNRLLRYRVYSGNPETGTLLRTVTYTYYLTRQKSNITIKDENPGWGGMDVSSVSYTAFGELLTSTGDPGGQAPEGFPRYQYAGEHGYESGVLALQGVNTALPPVTLQHVGYRWYQPDIGRFVQRDPIWLFGGVNVYLYCGGYPVVHIDPTGLLDDAGWESWHRHRDHATPEVRKQMDHANNAAATAGIAGIVMEMTAYVCIGFIGGGGGQYTYE